VSQSCGLVGLNIISIAQASHHFSAFVFPCEFARDVLSLEIALSMALWWRNIKENDGSLKRTNKEGRSTTEASRHACAGFSIGRDGAV